MEDKIDILVQKMIDREEKESYKYAEQLARIGSEEVMDKVLRILRGTDLDNAYLAAKVLGKMENRQMGLDPLLEVILDKENMAHNGALVEALEAFDLRHKFVEIFRLYLFGSFKASTLAKYYLDFTEFDITPRVIKKAEKHWNHYQNNVKHDDEFEIKKKEALTILGELKDMF
jgi:HEAT repeat protein